MHNVLSYQTAMRVNSGEIDVRQYVTKRSCVSIVLSVAFFTMVSGKLSQNYDFFFCQVVIIAMSGRFEKYI
jgi:hypothetical protein